MAFKMSRVCALHALTQSTERESVDVRMQALVGDQPGRGSKRVEKAPRWFIPRTSSSPRVTS